MDRLKSRWVLLGGLLLVLSLSAVACLRLAPTVLPALTGAAADSVDEPADGQVVPVVLATPVPQAPVAVPGRSAVVTRGSIAEQIPLTGRVAGATEFPITFPGIGKVESVPVKAGDTVKEGQLLVQTSAADTAKSLDAAQAKLETDTIRLQQGQAQAAAQETARQKDAASRQQDAATRKQAAIADATAALAAAQAEQQKVAAGPSDSDKRSAEIALTTAHANVQRAQADLDHLNRGADPADIRAAQRDVDNAQNEVNKAQAALNRLTAGPDKDAVTAAQRDVQRAQNALNAAQADKATSGAVHDAAVANAQLTLQDAQDRLNRLNAPVDPQDLAAAKLTLQSAQATLDNAKARLAALQQGPDQSSIDAAQAALDAASKTEQNAQALLDDLNTHPTPTETQMAAQKVAAASAALDRARNQPLPEAPASDAGAPFDQLLLQKAIDQDQTEIDRLQASLSTTKLLAPFDGTVASVSIRVGDLVDVGQPVVVLVKPGDPIVRVDLTEKDAARVAVGQAATLKLAAAPDAEPYKATLASLDDAASGAGKVAQFKVEWGGKGAALGAAVQLQLTVQSKDNVLIVPRKALRSAGSRRYVQYQDGINRKTANVEVGITAGDNVEIVSGLTEGQVVLVGP